MTMKTCLLLWCVPIQCFMTVCILGKCQGMDLSPTVYPSVMINVEYGKPLDILCEDANTTAGNLEFYLDGKRLDVSTRENETTIRLHVDHHEKGVYTYYCKNKVTRKNCTTSVLVDSTPSDVTDFACVSKSFDILNCSWSPGVNSSYSSRNYTLSFMIDGQYTHVCKLVRIRDEKCYCYMNTDTVPRYRELDDQFVFHMQICNLFGCNENNFNHRIDHYSVVKPDPPSGLKVLNYDSHSVYLQWNIPNNMVHLSPNGVEHKIEYQIANIETASYFRKVDTSGLPPKNKTYTFLLSDLPYAHMQYEVRIYIKTKEAVELWSDVAHIVFYTKSEKPKRPPSIAAGAFLQEVYETERELLINWKQLEDNEKSGANFTYKIVVRQESRDPITILADNAKSLSYITLKEASLGPINVEVWSLNDQGSSINSSHLYIPPYSDTVDLRVLSFTKFAYYGTHIISWFGLENIDNYTVFWCRYDSTKVCDTSKIHFKIMEPNKTYFTIELPKESRYNFAISANSGLKSSGMVWATCDMEHIYSYIQVYRHPVKLHHDSSGKTFVKISWSMPCSLEGLHLGYGIAYCPVLRNNNLCEERVGNRIIKTNRAVTVITNPKQYEVNITNLKPNTTYEFIMSLILGRIFVSLESASTKVTTAEDQSTYCPTNVKITNVESDSVVISWDPPLNKERIIEKYVFYNNETEIDSENVTQDSTTSDERRSFTLKYLDGFTNYSLSVAACDATANCYQSHSNYDTFVRTRIGRPSKLALKIDSNPRFIKWNKPEKTGGTVDIYQVWKQKDQSETIYNTTNLEYSLEQCAGEEIYKVRAINYDRSGPVSYYITEVYSQAREPENLMEYAGEWSDPVTVSCTDETVALIVVFSIIAVAIVIRIALEHPFFKLSPVTCTGNPRAVHSNSSHPSGGRSTATAAPSRAPCPIVN